MHHVIQIEGMSCQHCVHAVKEALSQLEGLTVTHVEVGKAEVDVQTPSALERVRAVMGDEGFQVSTIL